MSTSTPPYVRYIPELQLADGEPADDITVRHLLQQTSGLPANAGGEVLASAVVLQRQLRPGRHGRGARLGDGVPRLCTRPNPRTARHDAQLRVRRARSRSWPDTGHRFWFGQPVSAVPVHREAILSAGYLISTAEDMGRYLAMYLDGGVAVDGTRVVSRSALQTMLAAGPQARLGPWADGQTSRYAMGWFVGGPWSEPATLHPGNSPDSTAMIALLPGRGLAVATLINAGHELPVPGNPAVTDRISRNAVAAALGEPTTDQPSMDLFYLLFDVVVLALSSQPGGALPGP